MLLEWPHPAQLWNSLLPNSKDEVRAMRVPCEKLGQEDMVWPSPCRMTHQHFETWWTSKGLSAAYSKAGAWRLGKKRPSQPACSPLGRRSNTCPGLYCPCSLVESDTDLTMCDFHLHCFLADWTWLTLEQRQTGQCVHFRQNDTRGEGCGKSVSSKYKLLGNLMPSQFYRLHRIPAAHIKHLMSVGGDGN